MTTRLGDDAAAVACEFPADTAAGDAARKVLGRAERRRPAAGVRRLLAALDGYGVLPDPFGTPTEMWGSFLAVFLRFSSCPMLGASLPRQGLSQALALAFR